MGIQPSLLAQTNISRRQGEIQKAAAKYGMIELLQVEKTFESGGKTIRALKGVSVRPRSRIST